jgi:hypothetical protein
VTDDKTRESYETESGLLSDYVGEVTDAWFGTGEKFGNTQLFLKQTTDSTSTPEITEKLTTGNQWASYDGGKTVENTEYPDKVKFNKNSRMGQFIDRLGQLGAFDVMMERGPTQAAATYIGLRLRWESVSKEYTMDDPDNPGKKKSGTSNYNLPVEFLGVADGTPTTITSSPTSSSSREPTGTPSILSTLSDDLVQQLAAARADSATHHEFVDKAMTLTGVRENVSVIQALADENQLWKELA